MSEINPMSSQPPATASRREVLRLTSMGIGLALGGVLSRSGRSEEAGQAAAPHQPADIAEKRAQIIAKAYKLGYDYEKEHGGCAQCTVAALQDAVPFVAVDEDLFRGASCLSGGATPKGIANCGAFTGSGMIIGYVCGRTRDKTFEGSTKLGQQLIRKVYKRFDEEYGSVLCKDVRKAANRKCPEVVGRAAKWAAEVMLEEPSLAAKLQEDCLQACPTAGDCGQSGAPRRGCKRRPLGLLRRRVAQP